MTKTHFTLAPIAIAPGFVTGPAECGAQLRSASGRVPRVTDLPAFVSCKKCLALRAARIHASTPAPVVGDLVPNIEAGAWGERFVTRRLTGSDDFYVIDSTTGRITSQHVVGADAIRLAHAQSEAAVEVIKETPTVPAQPNADQRLLALAEQTEMLVEMLAAVD